MTEETVEQVNPSKEYAMVKGNEVTHVFRFETLTSELETIFLETYGGEKFVEVPSHLTGMVNATSKWDGTNLFPYSSYYPFPSWSYDHAGGFTPPVPIPDNNDTWQWDEDSKSWKPRTSS